MQTEAQKHARRVVRLLKEYYPEATCALEYRSPVQLLVATILSAQCTDKRVNQVTKELFARYPSARELAQASQADVERIIESTGFFRAKAKNIRECCQQLVAHHGGEVPRDLESLVKFPGVGRKTANVVLGTAFGLATGVVVDTHVTRLSQRLGLTDQTDAVKIERQLMELIPRAEWIDFSHRMIHHGRKVCVARRPRCQACGLYAACPRIGVESPDKTS